MSMQAIQVGNTLLHHSDPAVSGEFVMRDGAEFYKISNYDQMPPFFISVVSDADHWLYISSKGGLSAGRVNPENALFPYYTDDKIHDSGELTGSKTLILVEKEGKTYLWEPFSDRYAGAYSISRNLYKNISGNQLIFEEENTDLGLIFSYGWYNSQKYGFIKKSTLTAQGATRVRVRVLDGLQNLLPYGVGLKMQTERSTLLDAYKKNELLQPAGLGLFLLSSIPVDKAEPSESLQATTVWTTGIEAKSTLLCSRQLAAFRQGKALELETDIRAARGAYFIEGDLSLGSGDSYDWYFAAEVNQGPAEVVALEEWIKADEDLAGALEVDISVGTEQLNKIVASSDGLQMSSDQLLTARHFGNVLFNVMRGGIFDHNYKVSRRDFTEVVTHYNSAVAQRQAEFLNQLPETIHYGYLLELVTKLNDPQLHRLCLEYLPLTFSRRHGDPSRPWNRFSIELEEADGAKKLYYEGNWRDIFQNWEALGLSYPLFLEGMISKFVSASTADGYNPYRITRNGIDWEVIEEDDPWSYIGYWGDHQIIYLLKLLELCHVHQPAALGIMMTQRRYAYANVPYRIRGYEQLLADPQDTVDFDHDLEATIAQRVAEKGADGKLMFDQNSEVYMVNLTEKLLVTLLAKLSNFIPEAGIWLNTQRPEWNDANNALVGSGVSMVTLYYIRRYVSFCQSLFAEQELSEHKVSEEVADLLQAIASTFSNHKTQLAGTISDEVRRKIVDELGVAGEAHRNKVYQGFSGTMVDVAASTLDAFFSNVLDFVDHSIRANKRSDNLYHSYNLMSVTDQGGIAIRYLYEMLEGQVAVLSAGLLNTGEVLELLTALRASKLYREDQHSYVLYPDRQLPRFEVKNTLPKDQVEASRLLQQMVKQGDERLVVKDVRGDYHFNGDFNNQKDIEAVLADLTKEEYGDLPQQEAEHILAIFESVFDHQSFTGRSGTFFGYEGLGSIYWHMVSKLILAVAENCWQAIDAGESAEDIQKLITHYYDLRDGLGTHKSPAVYGAFPMDPYSHTPGHAGARQPGMTGQVKEDILSRFFELGVFMRDGQLECLPGMLQDSEFLAEATSFTYCDVNTDMQEIEVPAKSLVFTYCQVPFVYHQTDTAFVKVHLANGDTKEQKGSRLSKEWSTMIMERTNSVLRVEVGIVI
ncbi:MAG: hypothetical protein AAFZ63_11370 [Bacteroidota bacterium]